MGNTIFSDMLTFIAYQDSYADFDLDWLPGCHKKKCPALYQALVGLAEFCSISEEWLDHELRECMKKAQNRLRKREWVDEKNQKEAVEWF